MKSSQTTNRSTVKPAFSLSFHGKIPIAHDEISIFHSEIPIFHLTIPFIPSRNPWFSQWHHQFSWWNRPFSMVNPGNPSVFRMESGRCRGAAPAFGRLLGSGAGRRAGAAGTGGGQDGRQVPLGTGRIRSIQYIRYLFINLSIINSSILFIDLG
jgi:hypothetical protein